MLSLVLTAAKQPAEAVEQLIHALEMVPDDATLWARMGALQRELGDEAAVRVSYTRVLELQTAALGAQAAEADPLVQQARAARDTSMWLLLKNLLFTAVVPATVAGYLPALICSGQQRVGGVGLVVAVALYAVGTSLYAWCVFDFASAGRGTPLPLDAPKSLVVRGLYRYTRNPMYLGVLGVVLGWASLYRSAIMLVYALVVATGFQLFTVCYEEPHLRREFGPQYDDYCARVGRWLPRLRRAASTRARSGR